MKTIGELIDALLNSDASSVYLFVTCRDADPETMAKFRALPITEENVRELSRVIATTVRNHLMGGCGMTDEEYVTELRECHEFFGEVWRLVSDLGISKESVDVPISFVEMAVADGIVQVENGLVSLTPQGEAIAREALGER